VTERELIIKALNLLRECIINIRHSREEYNGALIDDINVCILDLENLPEEVL
jgi:hypothetical protein